MKFKGKEIVEHEWYDWDHSDFPDSSAHLLYAIDETGHELTEEELYEFEQELDTQINMFETAIDSAIARAEMHARR